MIASFHEDMEGLSAGLGMSTHADVVGSRRFRYHGGDPLLFETFGQGNFTKQVEQVSLKDRGNKLFKSVDQIFEENKEEFDLRLGAIKDDSLRIDVGFDSIDSLHLNYLMKEAVKRGVSKFYLDNVMGQRAIGTGIKCDEITVRGLVGNHSFAFVRDVKINVIPNHETVTTVPANAQVGIANTSNPKEINIAGEVSDLFAAYAVSGTFRVAKSGGVRNLLLMKAGIPDEWKNLNVDEFVDADKNEILAELVRKYQERKALRSAKGWQQFLRGYEEKLSRRQPPVAIYGVGTERAMGDYFMEYAQGGVGIVLNIANKPNPIGYYVCSGMTAGAAYIRGSLSDQQLGVGVRKLDYLTTEDKAFLIKHIDDYIEAFKDQNVDPEFNAALKDFILRYEADKEWILCGFKKIIPIATMAAHSNE